MGGNLFPETRRIETPEMEATAQETCARLESLISKGKIPRVTKDKKDFGDIDLIVLLKDLPADVKANNVWPAWASACLNLLGNPPANINHTILSMEINKVQIDITATDREEDFTSNTHFCDLDPLSNMINVLLKPTPIRWTNNGCLYRVFENDGETPGQRLENITVCHNIQPVLAICGISTKKWEEGYESLQDLADHIGESPLFNPENLTEENLGAKTRARLRKRGRFQTFWDILREKDAKSPHPQKETQAARGICLSMFPTLAEQIEAVRSQPRKPAKNPKFNSDLAAAWCQKSGDDLQREIRKFAKTFENTKEKDEFITKASQEEIKNRFLNGIPQEI